METNYRREREDPVAQWEDRSLSTSEDLGSNLPAVHVHIMAVTCLYYTFTVCVKASKVHLKLAGGGRKTISFHMTTK